MTNPSQQAPAGSSGAPRKGWGRILSQRWFWVLSAIVLLSGIGVAVGYGLIAAARQDQVCTGARVNGLAALILSIGAGFTAWNAQCFRNPVWGSPWPAILVSLVTMAGAAAAASTVPMSLSRS
jgi:hypothetical protein